MKKRIIAIIALAALILGLLAGLIPAVSAAEIDRFVVGYSKKDLTPWVQSDYTGGLGVEDKTYTDDLIITVQVTDPANATKTISQKMVSVPLAGYGNTSQRMSTTLLDYLYATCIAITDGDGNII